MLVFHMMEETGTITIVGISNDSKKRSGSGGAPTADTTTTTTKSDRRDRGTSIAAAATTVPKSLRPIADRSIGRKLSVSGDPSEFTCADSSYFLKVDTISTHYRDDSALYKHYHRQEVDQLVKENIAYLQQQQQHRKPSPEGTHTKQQRRCCSNRTWLISENVECQLLGSTIVSINGVSMHGLDKHFQRKLLEQRKRPLYMKVQPSHYHLTASPVSISGQTLYTISSLQSRSDSSSSAVIKPKMVYDKISNQLFLSKYGSSYASKIRSKVDSITKDYLECDWKYQSRLSPQATLPQATVVSLYRYIESEMSKLELFNGKHKRGMSMPTELLEEHWDNIRSHIEMLVFNKVSDFTHRLWPLYREDYIKVNRDYEDLFNASSAAAAATGGSQKPAIIVAEEFIEIDLNLSARHRSGNGWAAAASSPSSSSSYPEVRIELSTDHSLYMKLAYMRFLTLRHVGLSGTSSDDDDDNSIDDGSRLQLGLHMMHMNNTLAQQEIWYLCMAEMTAAMLCTTPGEVLEKLVSAVHMIYHALGSYLNPDAMYAGDDRVVEQGRNHSCCGCESMHLLPQSTEQSSEERSPAIGAADTQMISIPTPSSSSSSDEYSMVCEQLSSILKDTTLLISAPASPDEAIDIKDISLESIGSESPKGTTRSHHHTLSADDLMPAITWVLIQANPPDVEYVVWMCNEFRHPSLVKGEEAFCLAQLSSALEFCRTSSFTSFDIQQDTYNAYLIRYNNTLKLLLSCKKGDVSSIRRLLKDGVDVNGLSPDYKDCPLTACIRYGRVEAFRCLLEVPSIDIHNTVVNLYSGSAPHQRCSILIVAAQCAQLDIVLLLLSRGADRHYKDDSGTTASSAIQSVIDSTSSSTSKSSSKSTNQSSSSNNSSSSNSNSNSMGKGDNNDAARLFLKKLELEYIELCLRIEPVCSMDLIDAIELDDQSAVAGLLLQRVPLNCLNTGVDSKLSPLIAAVHSEHMSILRILLNKHLCPHLDINYPNASGETALIVCVKECIKNPSQQLVCKAGMLLRAGADRYLVDIDNMSAMDYMSRGIESFTAFTRDILSSSAAKYDQSPPWEDRQVTSVAYSSIIADIQRQGGAQLNDAQKRLVIEEKMDALLDLQALLSNDPIGNDALQPNSNSTNNSKGNSKSKSVPIYGHAKAKNLHAVKALLYQGVDANEVCPEKNYSSLIAAVYNGDLAMLQVLLQANKLYRLTSTYDSSASKLARLNRYCYVKAGVGSTNISVIRSPDPVDHITVDVNQPDSTGMNALHYAAQIGNPSIVGALLQAGANRTSLNNKSHSPLDIATAHEHAEATDILRYDPQVVSICLAAKHGDWGVMKALLAQGMCILQTSHVECIHIHHTPDTPFYLSSTTPPIYLYTQHLLFFFSSFSFLQGSPSMLRRSTSTRRTRAGYNTTSTRH